MFLSQLGGIYVGYYYWSFLYAELSCCRHTPKTNGDKITAVTREKFQMPADRLHDRAVDRNNKEHDVCVILAPFCVTSFMNDGRYLDGHGGSKLELMQCRGNRNVRFHQTKSPEGAFEFQSHHILGIWAVHHITVSATLY